MKRILYILFLISIYCFAQEPIINIEEINIFDQEDPAFNIIRKAQKEREKNLLKIKGFQSEVYAKSSIRILERPDTVRFMGMDISGMIPNKGIVYLSESISRLYYQREPKRVKEEMIASKSVGFQSIFSLNRAQESLFNLYENRLYAEAFSERYFVSPIAKDALYFYNYSLKNVKDKTENHQTYSIYEIEILPKRQVDPIFYGTIFIEDQTYQIVDARLSIRKESQLAYIDSLSLHQQYQNIDQIWFPYAQEAKGYLQGFEVKATFDGVTYHENVILNPNLLNDVKKNKSIFDNEIFSVQNEALKDNEFWANARKVPLESDESFRYYRREQAEDYYQSAEYLKKLDQNYNSLDPDHILENRYEYRLSSKKISIGTYHLFEFLQYNPVEGYRFQVFPYLKHWHEDPKNYEQYYVQLRFGVGIFDEFKPGFQFGVTKSFNQFLDFLINAEVGILPQALHPEDPVSEHLNSIYSLLNRQNERLLMHQSYVKTGIFKEWKVGFSTFLGLEYFWKRQIPVNQFTHAWVKKGEFFPNDFTNFDEPNLIPENHFVKLNFQLRYALGQKYERIGNNKNLQEQIYPTLLFNYKLGAGKTQQNHFWELGADYSYFTKGGGNLHFLTRFGIFLVPEQIHFADYKHFRTSDYHFHVKDFSSLFYGQNPVIDRAYFLTLPPWIFSTDQSYFAVHFEHDLLGMLWNRVPGLRKIHLKWLWGSKLLMISPYQKPFVEYYLGFYNILKIIRIDIASHYYDGRFLLPQVRLQLKIFD